MLVDQVTAKIFIPKIVFNICDARKMRSDKFFHVHVYSIKILSFSLKILGFL